MMVYDLGHGCCRSSCLGLKGSDGSGLTEISFEKSGCSIRVLGFRVSGFGV